MLAYLFWHRPQREAAIEPYEQAQQAFHRSLAHRPPVGLRASWSFRVPELPWMHGAGPGYEDWYLLEDYSALGVLNEAAVGHGHRTAHDHAARSFGAGAGGLYLLEEGRAEAIGEAPAAVWVARAPGSARPLLGELLGDGTAAGHSCLFKRQLVLGPAPEFCLLAPEVPAGVAAERLPEGWKAHVLGRETLVAW